MWYLPARGPLLASWRASIPDAAAIMTRLTPNTQSALRTICLFLNDGSVSMLTERPRQRCAGSNIRRLTSARSRQLSAVPSPCRRDGDHVERAGSIGATGPAHCQLRSGGGTLRIVDRGTDRVDAIVGGLV